MKSAEKNMKQDQSHSPKSIWLLILKIVVVGLGLYVWGVGFVWAMVGLYICWSIIKTMLSCLISLAVIIGLILLILSTI